MSVLIPNERGLDRALALREELAARGGTRGVRRDQRVHVGLGDPQPQEREPLDRRVARRGWRACWGAHASEGLRCEGVISTAFGCPYEGRVPPERVLEIAARLRDAGAQEIGFGDTTGMANPRQVGELFALWREGLPGVRADRALSQHARAGPRERAGGAGGRGGQLRVELRRAGGLPGAGGGDRATSPARTSSRCCTRWGSRPASTWMRWWRARARRRRFSAGRWAATRSWRGDGGSGAERFGSDDAARVESTDPAHDRRCRRVSSMSVRWGFHQTVWTVGHSNHDVEVFLALVRRHRVAHVVDVRSHPYSRYAPHFNRDELQASIEACGIRYTFLGSALGGRPRREDQLDADGHALYDRMAMEPAFNEAIERDPARRVGASHRVAVQLRSSRTSAIAGSWWARSCAIGARSCATSSRMGTC